ncbi:methyl-accepting chemotaxis protein [Phaeovulum vinaykumarii]|uniref:Methyl-accepting chemotaxis protein n=1 Tax=Phaeovulum vinaykumarii TaxID=407234 RepID=A0A1N7L9G8_9RHOB|nr:methyl-accepting chemotaxis protein [Phaeovulum vinaykumarii]SIS70479.1 Methyl-accepting chemotaxis protein [Phaeovulum vinaykumarii]SOB98884.1 methyl-accepting chemotaxis protein [Phaeovulum vinaykumarii]
MKIRHQVLLLPSVLVLVTCALLGAAMLYLSRVTIDSALKGERDVAVAAVRAAVDAKLVEALALAETLASIPDVQRAVAAGDDRTLEAMFGGGYPDVAARIGLRQLQFHTPPATSLIRVHKLSKRGDDLSAFRQLVVDVNRTGQSAMGLERGVAGIGARGVAAIRHAGRHVGTVEFGFDIDAGFLRQLAERTGYDLEFYVLPKPEIGARAPAEVRRVAATFDGAELLDSATIARVSTGEEVDIDLPGAEGNAVGRAIPVRDAAGDVAGIYVVTRTSTLAAELAALELKVIVGATAAALAIALLLAWVIGRRIVNPICQLTRATTALAAGDHDQPIPSTDRRDELGEMARALEVFAGNLAEKARIEEDLKREEAHARAAEAAQRAREADLAEEHAARQRRQEERARAREEEEHHLAEERAEEARARLAVQERLVAALAQGLEALAQGDLTQRIAELPPEYEKLREDFNAAMAKLTDALGEIESTSGRIDSHAGGLADSARTLNRDMERNAAMLEQAAAALSQLTAAVQSSADGARQARELAQKARSDAETGVEVVNDAVAAMKRIETSAGAISRITGVIEEIAFQTNLLALNAGVEAARAGEAGRGFAVVASEVRALAQRSSEAAKEISGLIESSDAEVSTGAEMVVRSGTALGRIVDSVVAIEARIAEIAASSGEQATGVSEVNAAVSALERSTQQTATASERAAEVSALLLEESSGLTHAVNRFHLHGPETARRVA